MTKTITALFPLFLLLFSLLPNSFIQQHALAQGGINNNNSRTNSGSTSAGVIVGTGAAGAHFNNNTNVNNHTLLTYQNPDFGIKMLYPSNWIKQEDNLFLHTIVVFALRHEDIYDFTNTTLAELDLRVYNAPQNETFAKLNINQINTRDQTIINQYKNSTTTLGGLPAIKIITYYFGDVSQKEMQIWTFVPGKNILVELIYIVEPSKYSLYLPIVERMIDSVEIAR
jgi:hypothetical protein